ncbi:hypothetical protein Sa4125_43850 [Aureimonas sp. SA4125]|uniref:DUF4424 family protein n=1 Tax=Aureimonas sp. SA4125 TaxID=2826993 RepID=UPI001CC745D3|nr:DUF4424 family protein [Aureimonas sp. SA4125]BDA86843.1 hypothetical protein Sa4125_43850 [Aureimonas sp. SA4125]
MKTRRFLVLSLAWLASSSALAHANDSSAQKAAGGLELIANDRVRMVAEDLRISPTAIDIQYVFQNDGTEDQELTVAFPLPAIEGFGLSQQPVDLPFPDQPNFVGFTVAVDGKAIEPELEERAFVGDRDVTAILRRHGLGLNPLGTGEKALGDLSAEDYAELESQGIATPRDFGEALWRYEAKFHFDQTFPAGRPVAVTHSYRPVTGRTFLVKSSIGDPADTRTYCIDAGTKRAMAGVIRKAAAASYEADPVENAGLKADPMDGVAYSAVVQYILTTANNWAGPIGTFRLTIDKGAPGNVVSLCQDGLTKTSPTTFEFTARDYVPKRDLAILFASPDNEGLRAPQ